MAIDTAIEISPARMEGMIILPGFAAPKSPRILRIVTGTNWIIDIETAVNIHMVLLAISLCPFCRSMRSIAFSEKTVALLPAPKTGELPL